MFDEHAPQPAAAPPKDLFDDAPSNLPFAPGQAPAAPAPVPASAPISTGGVTQPLPPLNTMAPPAPATGLPSAPAPMMYAEEAPRSHGLRTVLVVLASLVVIAIAGFLAYKLVVQPEQGTDTVSSIPDAETPKDEEKPKEPEVPVVTTPVEEEPIVKDTDGDGLNDEEEGKYGTDPKLADSDRDGLGDREETQVYGTDPLDTDTDKDSYLDGQEVKSGFNPNGEGKLFELPR